MKVVIASTGEHMDSQASPVFGRCSHLLVVDVVDGNFENIKAIPNSGINAGGGAGIQTARIVGDEKPEAVISGSVGPNAFEVLKQLGIKAYKMVPGTVEENLALLSQDKLEELTFPARDNGMGRGGVQRGGR
ncbi:NifB/NifX family molybdenum-iron cluster-binding protein [Methanobacterium formicicum]|jgi:predicted Fe-Mo cluster-binding NifX family protein|uniref:NifB/NifX family molybdenum-iron cluster-binding protein n=1 Tax=Methanobacterium formicicum TaxID=2162 RepID=UPI002490F695|nr:NifB/NifX family molybdenum-iron cluster-binding protein [Methanobacterium formicicum]